MVATNRKARTQNRIGLDRTHSTIYYIKSDVCNTPQHTINDANVRARERFYTNKKQQQQQQRKTNYKLVIESCERMLESSLAETSGCFVVCYIRLYVLTRLLHECAGEMVVQRGALSE